jgi:hypothetical protein
MTTIKWTQSTVCNKTYRTQKFGNMLCDTIQGEVYVNDDGIWAGWFTNHSNSDRTEFRLGFASKGAAVKWVNAKLRGWGVGK